MNISNLMILVYEWTINNEECYSYWMRYMNSLLMRENVTILYKLGFIKIIFEYKQKEV